MPDGHTIPGSPDRATSGPGSSDPATFDAVVVGAGPAGSAAALALARAGRSVAIVERGPFPGSKNVYGGVVYGRVLDQIVPGWWEEVPVERWVVRRSTMMMTGSQSLSIDYRSQAWGFGSLQRDDHPALALRQLAGRRRRPGPEPRCWPPPWPSGWSGTGRAGWSVSAPTATGPSCGPRWSSPVTG